MAKTWVRSLGLAQRLARWLCAGLVLCLVKTAPKIADLIGWMAEADSTAVTKSC